MTADTISRTFRIIAMLSLFAFLVGCGNCHKDRASAQGEGSGEDTNILALIVSPGEHITVPVGEPVDFRGSVSGGTGPYTYRWEFGEGIPESNLKDPGEISFDVPAVYPVIFTVTDSKGLTSSASVVVTVIDTTPPTVISTIPENGAIGAAVDTPIRVTFSEDMDPATINVTSFTVSKGGVPIPGSVSISGSIAEFTPDNPLIPGVTYTATITTEATDLEGNALASDHTWKFTPRVSLDAGDFHTLAIGPDGDLWAWGSNDYGQLGVNDNAPKTSPVKVSSGMFPDLTHWAAVSAGKDHSLALAADGSLWAWGRNDYGQLGTGDTNNRNAPVAGPVVPGITWAMVSAGWYHTLAIGSDGSLWAWGNNSYGQLGTGVDTNNHHAPVRVDLGNDWAFVAAGAFHNLAIKKDGSLWAWGSNSSGQLGIGSTATATQPQRVSGTGWIMAAVGSYGSGGPSHSLALKADGTLWAWGNNSFGQLGLGNDPDTIKIVPQLVGSGWASISAGGKHSLAIAQDGTLWTWGNDSWGQLGNGDISYSSNSPRQIDPETQWLCVSAGTKFSTGIRSDGTFWAWGDNSNRQLGNGSGGIRTAPQSISLVDS